MWPVGEVESRIEHLAKLPQKVQLLKQQYCHVKAWYGPAEAKCKFPFAAQPATGPKERPEGKSACDVWIDTLKALQKDQHYAKVRAAQLAKVPEESEGILKKLEASAANLCGKLMSEDEIQAWNATTISNAKKTKGVRSKKHRDEAAAAEQAAKEASFGGFIPDDGRPAAGAGGEVGGAGTAATESVDQADEEDDEAGESDSDSDVSQGEIVEDDVDMLDDDGQGVSLGPAGELEQEDEEEETQIVLDMMDET